MLDFAKSPLAVLAALSMVACGGASGDGASADASAGPATLSFKGTVAIGAAVSNAPVSATCASGVTGTSAPTDSGGNYTLSIKAGLPCIFQTTVPNTNFVLRSMAATDGIANLSPLTEAVTVFSGADFARLTAGKTQLSTLMTAINSPLAGDPITTAFVANETGLDKNILSLTSYVANTSAGNALTGPNSLAPLSQVLASLAATCTAANIHCTLTELALAKIGSAESKAIAKELLQELDTQLFIGVGSSLYERSFDPAFRESIERAYKYAVALLIERVGPAVMKDSGISKSLALSMAAAFKDDAIATILTTPRSAILEVLMSSAASILIDHIEQAIMPTLALDGSWSDAWKSVGFGTGAFVLEVAAEDVLFCTFNGWACKTALGLQLVTLSQEVEVMSSWVYKDAEAFVDILRLNSSIEDARQRNLVMELLLSQYGTFTDPVSSGAYTWATAKAMSDPLATLMAAAIADAKLKVPALVGTNIDPAWRRHIQASHLMRLDRLAAKYVTIENTCRQLKASEGQVGVSKCLNAMNISPAAPLSCGVGQVLSNGACVGARGLVGHWTFDNCDARDASAAANHGTITGAPACVVGRAGKAFRFNGSTDWITVPHSASFPKDAITLAYWVHRENNAVGATLQNYISKELAFQSYLMTDSAMTAGLYGTAGWSQYGSAGTSLLPTLADWVHFAFTYENTTRRARLFLNGVLVSDTVDPDARTPVRESGFPLYLGRNGSANVYHVKGLLDEVRIYDRALSTAEVMQLVQSPGVPMQAGQ